MSDLLRSDGWIVFPLRLVNGMAAACDSRETLASSVSRKVSAPSVSSEMSIHWYSNETSGSSWRRHIAEMKGTWFQSSRVKPTSHLPRDVVFMRSYKPLQTRSGRLYYEETYRSGKRNVVDDVWRTLCLGRQSYYKKNS
ncbi:hypothetical protein F2Q69_00023253 [Brassica cretica]|uniref:Uncharacterized protein n=1 Tax=Brassica cretica TaxID=69181 RepID=A0A8S9QCE6_BRACR|nr:hypothetical protein F2Q69_00023253 [Brassica cretica]